MEFDPGCPYSQYHLSPWCALGLFKSEPTAFILLLHICFKTLHRSYSVNLKNNEISISCRCVNNLGNRNTMQLITPYRYKRSLQLLERYGYIKKRKDRLYRGSDIVSLQNTSLMALADFFERNFSR